jgi:hypothetical protein
VTIDLSAFDRDALIAGCDLVGRSGARALDIGYHEDEPKPDALNWYAQATFRGAKLFEEARDPIEAVERLARRMLRGARCRRCGEPIMLAGSKVARGCHWTRRGPRWEPGCGRPIDHSIPAGPL